MPKLKFLEAVSHEGRRYEKDDQTTVSDEFAKIACEHGWAEDMDGVIPTGERSTVPKTLNVKKMRQGHGADKVGG